MMQLCMYGVDVFLMYLKDFVLPQTTNKTNNLLKKNLEVEVLVLPAVYVWVFSISRLNQSLPLMDFFSFGFLVRVCIGVL